MREGKVYLAGGGCGDAELVTLKTIKVLQQCETVVYDYLVSEELLRKYMWESGTAVMP